MPGACGECGPAARSVLVAGERFATYLGWLIEWGTPLTLLGETAADVARAQRELVRIGVDRPAAAAAGKPGDWVAGTGRELATLATATFADLARLRTRKPPYSRRGPLEYQVLSAGPLALSACRRRAHLGGGGSR